MYGLLEPVFKENYAGRAEVLNVFKITKVGQIAGCRVTDGLIKRDAQVRAPPRRRRGLEGQDRLAQALQGRRLRSPSGRRVRYRPRRLQGHPGRRHHRAFTTEKLAAELGQNSAAARKAEKAEKEREAAAAAAAATAENSVNA